MGYFSKLTCFQKKNIKQNKGWQHEESRLRRILKLYKNQVLILKEIRGLNVHHYVQKRKNNANSRSDKIIIGWICIKIKSKNIIKFLIGQFDLIIGQIKV
jgi:hypothetical protein